MSLNKFSIVIIVLVLLILPEYSQADILGSQTGAFLRMDLGADRVAMGGTGAALKNSGVDWYYNPAAISTGKRRTAISYRNLALDRSIFYGGVTFPIAPSRNQQGAGIAFGFLSAGVSDIEGRDSNGEKYDTFTWSSNLIHGSFALIPHKMVSLGLSIKWMFNSVPKIREDDKTLYSYGLGLDIGARFQPIEDFSIGLQVRDIGSKVSSETSDVWFDDSGEKEDMLPTQIRFGIAYNPLRSLTLTSDLVAFTQYIEDNDGAFMLHAGAEWVSDFSKDGDFALRAGFNGHTPTFGIGIGYKVRMVEISMDYAFLIEQEISDNVHLITWTFGI